MNDTYVTAHTLKFQGDVDYFNLSKKGESDGQKTGPDVFSARQEYKNVNKIQLLELPKTRLAIKQPTTISIFP